MKTNIRKFPAVLLLAVLCLTVFPISAMAAGVAEVKIPVSVELSGEKPSPDETYTIILQGEDEAPMPEENTITITVALGFRAGFSFSAGAMDLLFSSSLPAAQKTWLILPLGIAAFIVFYVVFLFAIKKFDLKTPGREDDDDLEAEKNIELANDDYTAIAAKILEGCGGKENITSIDNCITRLRLEVKDITAVNDKVIKSAGVAGVIKPGKTSVQVIIGTKVQFVADAFSELCK